MQLPLCAAVLLGLLDIALAAFQGGKKTLTFDADSNNGFLAGRNPHADLSTAYLMFHTADSFFVSTERKDAALFTKSICYKLSQIVNVPWTRFGVYLTMYNDLDRTPIPGKLNYCASDKGAPPKIVCKEVIHSMNKGGVLHEDLLLQMSTTPDANTELTFEVNVMAATFKDTDTKAARDVAEELVSGAQDHDEILAGKFHMLFPNTQATLSGMVRSSSAPGPMGRGPWDMESYDKGDYGGQSQNTLTIGVNPSGWRSGALASPPKLQTPVDIAKEAATINAETATKLADLEGQLKRSAMAHFDAIRFTPYTPPEVMPSGPLMLPHEDYPPGPDF